MLNEECDEKDKNSQSIRKRERTNDEDDEVERLWDSMEVVETEKEKKKKKSSKKSKQKVFVTILLPRDSFPPCWMINVDA